MTTRGVLVEEDDSSDEEDEDKPTLRKQFVAFVKAKNNHDPGTHILLSQSDIWMKHAGVIRGRIITQTDTGVCFFKFKKYKLNYNEYLEFLQILAEYKKIAIEDIIEKMVHCGPPPKENNPGINLPR